ncbi:SGNH/GDSL hydrolase family protein [Candidatus Daviesbacteria bacterium]|nr:SGNH/GDSL hydrolase family protein [Candidatus Daviesbacteria bacterium]
MQFIPVCCLFLSSVLIFSPFLSLERTFAKPIYQIKKIFNPQTMQPKDTYAIVLVGDSMTDYLGSGVEIKKYLKKYYPNKQIDIQNFSVGSTNILTLPDRLQNLTNYNGRISQPILNTNFDLIIIESFGHNPLSQYSLEEGFKKQNQVLDQAISMIKQRQPQTLVIFLATIAPHQTRYAEGVANLSTEERINWAKERASYIKNHIDYAKNHKLPLINVYEKSVDDSGEGNIDLIDTRDFIHPSPTGIEFISREIAEFIFKRRILPL